MTSRATFFLFAALLMPAPGKGEEARCVKETSHHLRADLDDVDMFGAAIVKVISNSSVFFSEISDILGEPRWIDEVNGVKIAKWVHGSQEVTEEFFCSEGSRKIYSTEYYVIDASFKKGSMVKCSFLEDSYISLDPISWRESERPLLRKSFNCRDYFSKLK